MRWMMMGMLAGCIGSVEEAECDAVCHGTLDVALATPSESFGLEVVDGELSLQILCPEGTIEGAPAGVEVVCEPGRVSVSAPLFDWSERMTFGLAGETWELDLLTTDVELCGSVCTDASVTLPAVR